MDNSFLHRKKLLLVDDEPDLLKMVSDILSDAGFETVLTAATVKEAIITAEKEKPDLMVLDVMLPDGDGFSLMKQLRTFTNVPIIFLTAKDEAADKLAGLGLGADDYISKPFMPQELLLRVYAVLRRTYKEDSPRVFLDGCTIDFSRAEVNKGGEIIPLTAKEHTLLETLARNEGKIVNGMLWSRINNGANSNYHYVTRKNGHLYAGACIWITWHDVCWLFTDWYGYVWPFG